jgi:hypothetical protein
MAVIVIALVFAVLHWDAEDAQAEHEFQCQMISEGSWPESVNRGCGDE